MSISKDILEKRLIEKDDRFEIEDYINLPSDKIMSIIEPIIDSVEAAKLIKKHIDNKNLIVLAVDIDCDGINSGSMGYKAFRSIFNVEKENIKLVISSRLYKRGFNQDLINKINKIKTSMNREIGLVITADMGSYDNENYKLFKKNNPNTDIIVTDHHQVPYDNYPTEVNYFVNPHRKENTFGKQLCGCGVLFMLIREVYLQYYPDRFDYLTYQDLGSLIPFVALATIVDMMSMKDIFNRYLISVGLDTFISYDRNFVNYFNLFKINRITYKECSTLIGPLINTANRVSAEEYCLSSLSTENDAISIKFLNYIQELNKIRKAKTDEALSEFMQRYDNKYLNSYIGTINSDIYISGSVASSISSTYLKPSIIFLNSRNDIIGGSGRSGIDGLDILSILKDMPKDIVIDAAGHKSACGVSIYKNKLEEFRELFDKKIEDVLKEYQLPSYEPEGTLHVDGLELLADDIINTGPYGVDFPEPIWTTYENFTVRYLIPIRNFYKIVFTYEDSIEGTKEIIGMHFFRTISKNNINILNIRDKIKPGMEVKLLFYLNYDYHKSEPELQLEIVDIIPQLGEN